MNHAGCLVLLATLGAACALDDAESLGEVTQEIGHESSSIAAPDEIASAAFGASVAMRGGRMVVGAPGAKGTATSGAVYVFARPEGEPWLLEAKLTPTNPDGVYRFGQAVALDDERIAVSARHESRSWVIYLFERSDDEWRQTARLWAPSPTQPLSDYMDGRVFPTVALVGDALAAGLPVDGEKASELPEGWQPYAGAVLTYRRTLSGNWVVEQKLFASSAVESLGFGYSIDMSGSRLLVGSMGRAGAVFDRNDSGIWGLTATVSVPSGRLMDEVALDDDVAMVSSFGSASWFFDAGVTVFKRINGAWNNIQFLALPPIKVYWADLEVQGTYAALTNLDDCSGAGTQTGCVYLFRSTPTRTTWWLDDQLAVSSGAWPLSRVAMDIPNLVAGSSGAVHLFEVW